jgi:hypothetical protein
VGIESFLLQNVAVRNDRGIVYACPSNAVANSAWGNASEDLLEIDAFFCTFFEGHNSYGSTGSINEACELLGFTDCLGTCTATNLDPDNCGACGNQCSPGEVCSGGSCAAICPSNLSECSGTCADLNNDESNCGSCGNTCDPGHLCVAGSCTLSCQVDLWNCAGVCTNLATDENHCGSCGSSCSPGQFCSSGTCTSL